MGFVSGLIIGAVVMAIAGGTIIAFIKKESGLLKKKVKDFETKHGYHGSSSQKS